MAYKYSPIDQCYIGLSTDTKPAIANECDKYKEIDTGNIYRYIDGVWSAEYKYKDLGLVVDAVNMAAGATVYSNWYDNLQWVRSIKILCSSDQQYDIVTASRDTALFAGFDSQLAVTQGATALYRPHSFNPNSANAVSLLGYSARFGIKNSSASANTYAKLRVQLMGL